MTSKTTILAALVALAGGMAPAMAAQDFSRAVEERYRAVESAIAARDARAWFEALYSPDIVLTGEGSTSTIRGRAALMPVIEDIVKATRSCSLKGDKPARASQDLGYSFVTYSCQSADPKSPDYQVRALYVWQRERAGWRVVAEMYQSGSM